LGSGHRRAKRQPAGGSIMVKWRMGRRAASPDGPGALGGDRGWEQERGGSRVNEARHDRQRVGSQSRRVPGRGPAQRTSSRVCGVEGLRSVAGWEPGLNRKAVVAFMPEALTCPCSMLTDEAWPRALQPAPLLGAAKVCTTLRNHWDRQANDLSEG
jgi:hypothetical protein